MSILARLHDSVTVQTEAAATELAQEFAQALPIDQTVCFSGDLGSGKTTFIRAMAAAWEIPGPITSPTFNLFNIHVGARQLIHLDAYRLVSPDQFESLMLDEFLRSPYCLAVEWPERIDVDALPPPRSCIRIRILPDNVSRHITLIS